MTGGWGNGFQQVAAALGAGEESAAGTAAAMQKQALDTRNFEASREEKALDRDTRVKEGELNRASRQEIEGIKADNRMAVEESRAQSRQARLQAIHGMGPKVFSEYMGSYNKHKLELLKNQTINRKSTQEIDNEAHDSAWNAVQKGMAAQKGGAENPEATPPAAAPRPGAAAPETPGKRLTWAEVQNTPGFEEAMSTQAGIDKLKQKYPYLDNDIKVWEGRKKFPTYGERFYGRR